MTEHGNWDAVRPSNRSDDPDLLSAIVETAPDAIIVVDQDGAVVLANRRAQRFFGYERKELVGQRVEMLLPELRARYLADPQPRPMGSSLDLRALRKDGVEVAADISLTPITTRAGTVVSMVIREVADRTNAARSSKTAHDELERRVQERTAELAESVRLRDEFLSVASHELKTPLSAMLLQLQMLKGAKPEEYAGRVDKASRSTRRLARLIDVLLDVSRIATGRFELQCEDGVDLVALVREVNERCAEDAAHAECDIEVEAHQPVLGRWDRFRIEQVYTNLLANAVKHGKGSPIQVRIADFGDTVTLSVCDHGSGIAPDEISRVFARFERAVSSRHYGGLGLGLYIAREIVAAHRGSIDVESKEGVGSTFTVKLPRRPVVQHAGGRK